ncbi:MAG: hypothetical protein H0W36_12920 [Gemmatimonadetes bacterium]|nr:hypothetical protein [Gemmatimonadota bacterium]
MTQSKKTEKPSDEKEKQVAQKAQAAKPDEPKPEKHVADNRSKTPSPDASVNSGPKVPHLANAIVQLDREGVALDVIGRAFGLTAREVDARLHEVRDEDGNYTPEPVA